MRRVFVNPERPHRDAVQEAAKLIRSGEVVALPTDTLYGLAANPFNPEAVLRVFEAKRRPPDRPLPLIAADVEQVSTRVGALSKTASALAAAFWPGPLTLLVEAPPSIGAHVTAGTGRVGVRVPNNTVARAVCLAVGHPITATSANISDEPATADPNVVEDALGDRIALLLDAGTTPGGAASTIVDVTVDPPRLVRAGAISWEQVQACVATGSR